MYPLFLTNDPIINALVGQISYYLHVKIIDVMVSLREGIEKW